MKWILLSSIFTITVSCNYNANRDEYKLSIKCICAIDVPEISKKLINDKDQLLYCEINNNKYDTLFIPLYHFELINSWMIKADDIENYQKADSVFEMASTIYIYTPPSDTIIKLSRKQSISVILRGECPDNERKKGAIYYLYFDYDSLGIKKSLIMNYANFDTLVPIEYPPVYLE